MTRPGDRPPSSPTTKGSDRYEHRFGSSPPLSLGVEEELLLVDERCRLVAEAEAVLERVPEAVAGRVSTEIFAEQIELKTSVCHGVDDVLAELTELRRTIAEAGFHLLGAGLHPASTGEPTFVSNPRYEVVREDFGSLLRTPPCGLHVHVGIPDPDLAVRLTNAFRRYLPALQALSANSPFQEGADSGHASARTSVVRGYPRFQVPREFRDYEDFCRVADQLIAAAGVDDYTYIWWDVRPHPQLGTVEVRALDVQMDPGGSTAIAALVQAIAARELADPETPDLSREALEESYFQAASHGLDAEILLDSASPAPAREVCRRVLDVVRPYAVELGSEAALTVIERILREGNGADEQRRVHARAGMDGLLRHLAKRTRAESRTALPSAGPLSDLVVGMLSAPRSDPTLSADPAEEATRLAAAVEDPLGDDDLQLALYLCFELHYRSFAGVDPAWEWDPSLLAVREVLERAFFSALDAELAEEEPVDPNRVGDLLFRLESEDEGASLSRYLEIEAGVEEFREFVVHRSFYQLKESDPHSWAIPRLDGPAKTALLEVQADEYGGGRPERMHSRLFAKTMRALGLDERENAYLECAPGATLATVNLMSATGLRRGRRGMIVGHLAMFEMTSTLPNRRYGNALRRLGFGEEATDFYDEHVEADAVHENIAAHDLAGGLARQEPELAADIVYGARALLFLEDRFARHLLAAWREGRSSLRLPLAGSGI